jgi:hypothetical protein
MMTYGLDESFWYAQSLTGVVSDVACVVGVQRVSVLASGKDALSDVECWRMGNTVSGGGADSC